MKSGSTTRAGGDWNTGSRPLLTVNRIVCVPGSAVSVYGISCRNAAVPVANCAWSVCVLPDGERDTTATP